MRKKLFKKAVGILAVILMAANVQVSGFIIEPEEEVKENTAKKMIICIDPGHQAERDSRGEPVSPGSGSLKARVSAGTVGVATKNPEYKVNLEAALILKEMLDEDKYDVVMTRETNEVNISNIERAKLANKANADITVRIHCDSVLDGSKTGATILIPSRKCINACNIYEDSSSFANILKEKLKGENIKVNGVFERADITGFNWSEVPVVILEMGFMSNYEEDRMLGDSEYQKKLMECVKSAIEEFSKEETKVLEEE